MNAILRCARLSALAAIPLTIACDDTFDATSIIGPVELAEANSHDPVPPFAVIAGGSGEHSCALTADGAAYCWGQNASGQFGNGSTGLLPRIDGVPVIDPTPASGGWRFTAIDVGSRHTCALTEEGKALCWGSNNGGQIGDGTTSDRLVPTPVKGDLSFVSITLGNAHSCGLTADGDAYCWGFELNSGGIGVARPNPVRVEGGQRFFFIDAGLSTTCALGLDRHTYCWGRRLDAAELIVDQAPHKMATGIELTSLAVGSNHICGLVADGSAYCVGVNEYGQLGDGTRDDRASAVPVSGGITFTSIDAGVRQSCGLATDGTVYCWGAGPPIITNEGGPPLTVNLVPTKWSDGEFIAIAAGLWPWWLCALDLDGAVTCLSSNFPC